MDGEFKMIEFTCKFNMQIKIKDNMTKEEVIQRIEENFDFVREYGASECDDTDDYSAYMGITDIDNIEYELKL